MKIGDKIMLKNKISKIFSESFSVTLESISEITIPKGKYYNLTDLKQGTNVGLKLKVNQLDEQVVFTLGKQTANNVWVASGYSVQLDSVGKYIQILTSEKKDGKESDIKRAELTNVDLSGSFELEYGVADMFEKNDKNTDTVLMFHRTTPFLLQYWHFCFFHI